MLHEKLIGTKYTNVAQASVTGKIRLAFYNTDLTLLMLKKNTNFMGPCCQTEFFVFNMDTELKHSWNKNNGSSSCNNTEWEVLRILKTEC